MRVKSTELVLDSAKMEKSLEEEFNSLIQDVTDDLATIPGYPSNLKIRMANMIRHITPNHVYSNVAFVVPKAYRALCSDPTESRIKLAVKLGCCYQLYQAFYYMVDDFVDHGDMRYGVCTWTKLNEKAGNGLVYDMLMLERAIYALLRKHLGNEELLYCQIVTLFGESGSEIWKGNNLESFHSVSSLKLGLVSIESFNEAMYRNIASLKGTTLFYMPIALAMILAGLQVEVHRELFAQAKRMCSRIGILFQAMDDFYDSFTEDLIDTKDSDISRGVFSWLFLTAKDSIDREEDLKSLIDNYGNADKDSFDVVKNIYEKVNMRERFAHFKDKEYKDICFEIENIFEKEHRIGGIIKWYLDYLLEIFTA